LLFLFSEDDEPVVALDLRIGKAVESITIFDDRNVLGPDGQLKAAACRVKQSCERFSPYGGPRRGCQKGKAETNLIHISILALIDVNQYLNNEISLET